MTDHAKPPQSHNQALIMNMSLESSDIEAIASLYPDTIREDYIWLANHVRDACSRNLDVLVHAVRKLGFPTDKTTFSKILRGLWNRDAKGRDSTPIMSVSNLNQIVDALRSETQLVWIRGRTPFIDTEQWTAIKDYIDFKRAPETICKFGLILGPTGSQKTSCLKRYTALNNSGKCVNLEAPEKATMGRFVRELGSAYGIPEKITGEKLRTRIKKNVTEKKTIILDNVQRLYRQSHGWNQEIFNFLQKLNDDTGCTVILCAVPEFEMTLTDGLDHGYFEQFIGRVGGAWEILRLPDWTSREDIRTIAKAFKLDKPHAHLRELEILTRRQGRIRILFNALQKARRAADGESETLTIEHIREAVGLLASDPITNTALDAARAKTHATANTQPKEDQ